MTLKKALRASRAKAATIVIVTAQVRINSYRERPAPTNKLNRNSLSAMSIKDKRMKISRNTR